MKRLAALCLAFSATAMAAPDPSKIGPALDIGHPVVSSGAIDVADVVAVLAAHDLPLLRCFNTEVVLHATAEDEVLLELDIGANGTVKKLETTDLDRKSVGRCVAKALDGVTMPKPTKAFAHAVISLNFRALLPVPRTDVPAPIDTRVTLLSLDASGGVSSKSARKRLGAVLAAVNVCYERELASENGLAETLVANLWVDAHGAVELVTVGNGPSTGVMSCARHALASTTFTSVKQKGNVLLRIGLARTPHRKAVAKLPVDWSDCGCPAGPSIYEVEGIKPPPPAVRRADSTTVKNVTATDGLDSKVVRRYVKRNLEKLSYCYEKQLLVKPMLSGELTATFQINENGAVVPGVETKFKKSKVAACVTNVLRGIELPMPHDGQLVTATLALHFQPPVIASRR